MGVLFIWFCLMVVLIGIMNSNATNTSNDKQYIKRNSINTYGKYKQAKRYYGYSRGRKMW